MSVSIDVQDAIDLRNLPLPPGIRVVKIEAEDMTDWTGEPSLRVDVLLDESVDVEKLSGAAIGDFKSGIRESLRKHGIDRFAYIFLAKPSEFTEENEE